MTKIYKIKSKLTFSLSILVICLSFNMKAQLSGTKNIPGDYATLALAISDLNAVGVGPGGVTLNLISGTPQTAPAGGYSISATGIVANPITIQGNSNVITASSSLTAGALNDAIFKIIGGDFITITGFNMQENAVNTTTTAATNNMTEFGIALFYATTTDGSQNISIVSNTITLNRAYQNTFGIYANSTHNASAVTTAAPATGTLGGTSNLVIYSNNISNINTGILVVGPTAAADQNQGLDIGGSSLTQGNSISNFGTTGTFSAFNIVSATVNGIQIKNTGNYNISYNNIASSNGGTISGTLNGIQITAYSNAPTIPNTQSISNNSISLRSAVAAGAMNGINVAATTANTSSSLTINNNDFNNFGHTITSSGAIVFILNASPIKICNVLANTFSNISVNTTGSVTFIRNDIQMPASGIQNINNNNIVGSFTKTGAGGTVQVYLASTTPSSPVGSIHNATGNNFSYINVSGATTLIGWSNLEGAIGGGATKTISSNTFKNWTGGSSAITAIATNYSGDNTIISNNLISSITGSAAITGISIGTSNGGTSQTVANNTISAIASAGTVGAVVGITGGSSSITTLNINNNRIYTCSSTGASAVTGLILSASSNANVFKNKIYDLLNSNAAGTAIGITNSGGTKNTIYNNTIGDLKATIASLANAVIGLNITSGTTANLYYNSVYLAASSTGALFGNSAIYVNTATNVDLRNNIFVNLSAQTGTGTSVAYRRSSPTLTTYSATSNNNLFYSGSPSPKNLIFSDGTNDYITLPSFQTAMVNRDQASVTENPTFLSTTGSSVNFLHINPATVTVIEGGAANIATFTDDYDGDIRQGNAGYAGTGTSPDIGADEFNGISPAPSINALAISPIGNQCVAVGRVITATVTPGASNLSSVTLNYSFNGVAQPAVTMTGGSVSSASSWTGNIPVAVPSNANVAWNITVLDGTYTKISNGTSYKDEPLLGVFAQASASLSTICAGSPSTLTPSFGNSNSAANYGVMPSASSATYEDIGNVSFGPLNNTSPAISLVGTIGTASGIAGRNSDFTAFGPYNYTAGNSYILSVSSLSATGAPVAMGFGIFIDYNRNGVFTDAGEFAYATPSASMLVAPATETASITIPITALNGLTRMRVVLDEAVVTSPTQGITWGEYEEYMLNISSANQGGGSVPTFTAYAWNDGTSAVASTSVAALSPTTTTTYSVIATDINGCSVTSSPVTVTVVPVPTIPTVTNTAQCGVGASASAVSGGTSYNWYSTPTSTTVLQSGVSSTYTTPISATSTFYVASDNGVCLSPRAAVTTSVSLPDPIYASASATNICPGNSILLSSTQGVVNVYTFTWTATPAAGSGIPTSIAGRTANVTPTTAGTYVYQVFATDGICSTTSSVSVVLNNPPTISATANPNIVCSTASVNLNATTPVVASGTAVVGSGTALTSAFGYPTAFGNYWYQTWQQYLFTASELTAMGIYPGNITSLTFNIAALPSPNTTITDYNVKIATTSNTALSAFVTTGLTNVFGPANVTAAIGLNTIALSTPYNWDGVSNIVIDLRQTEFYGNANATTYYTPTTNNSVLYAYSTTSNPSFWTSSPFANTSTSRPNITFAGQVATQGAGSLAWQWNPGAINTNTAVVNPVNSGTAAVTQNYTVTATDPVTTCSNTAVVAVLVNPLPVAPTVANSVQCGVGVPTASVSGGTIYNWYATATSTAVLQAGTSPTFTSSINSTTSWYVSSYSGTCEGPRAMLTTTVNTPDAVRASASNTAICIGQPITLTVAQTGSSNTYVYTWTASPISGSGIPSSVTGSSAVITPTASGNYNYLVTAIDGLCTTTDYINVIVNSLPIVSASASPSVVCSTASVNLNATTPVVASGTALVGSGTALTSAYGYPTAFGNYWYQTWQQYLFTASELSAMGLSAGNITSLAFNIAALPSPNTTITDYNVKIATTSNTALSAFVTTGLTNVFGPANVTAAIGLNTIALSTPYNWDGVSNIVIDLRQTEFFGNANATTYYTPTTNNSVLYAYSTSSNPSFWTSSPFPTTSTSRPNITFAGQVVTQGAGSLAWQWNPGSINTNTAVVNPVNSGTAAVTNVYTVSVTNPTTTCSNSATVSVVVNPLPTAPVVANSIQCGLAVPTASVSGGTSYNWYASPTSTTVLQSGASSTYTTAINSTTNFYVSSYNGACESVRSLLTVTVNTADNITASASSSLACPGSPILLSSTQGTVNIYTFTWTATPATGSGIPTSIAGNTTNVTPTIAGTYVYQVFGTDGLCSTTSTVSVTLNNAPVVLASASPTVVCSTGSVNLNAASVVTGTATTGTGTNLTSTTGYPTAFGNYWYQTWQQYLFTASELSAMGLSAGNITSLTFNIAALPSPNTTITDYNVKIATTSNTALSAFVTTGLTNVFGPANVTAAIGLNTIALSTPYNWDGVSNIVIDLRQTEFYGNANATTYYTPTTNNSVLYAYTTTSNPSFWTSSPAPITSTSRPNIIIGGTYIAQSAGSLAWQWNPGAINTNTAVVNPVNSGTAAVTQNYTVTATDPVTTCSNSAVVAVVVNPLPTAPVVANSTQCGVGVPTASVSGGTTYNWYNAATSGTLVQTGTSSTYTSAVNSTTTYYVSSYDGTCEGTRSMITASVNIPDAVTATIGTASVCPNTTVSLLATNTGTTNTYSYTWTGAPVIGSGIATSVAGTSVVVTPSLPGNYIYTVTAIDGICTTIGTTTLNVFQALTTPPIASGSPNPVCAGSSSVELSASFGSTVMPAYTTPPSVVNPMTDEDLGNITFGSLNNTSAINSLSGSIGNAAGTAGDYSDFTAFGPYTYNLGSTYTLSLNSLQATSAYGNAFGLYIDYNKNGVFTDAGEAVYVSPITTLGAHTETASITIPASATPGITRLRVIVNEGLVTGPTMSVDYGEYEEYSLNLIPIVTYNWTDGSSSIGTSSTLTVSPAVNTTYSYIVTDLNSCSLSSAPVTITVNPLPVINATAPSSTICANTSATLSATGATTYTWAPVGGNAASAVVTPTANTTYTVTGSLLGCISTNTISLATIASPTLNVVSSSTSAVCAGTSATITTSGTATSFTWSPAVSTTSTAVVSPTANATYTVVGFDAGCSTTETISIAVTANPTINLAATNTVICLGSTTSSTINATGTATSFTWTPAVSSTSSAVVSPTVTETYTVVGLASGCTTTTTITVNVANTPSVTAIAPNNVICAGSTVTLTSTGTATNYTWSPVGGNGTSAIVSPTSATSYTLLGEAAGCTNSSVVTLTVSALPIVTAVSSSSAICKGESAVLTASTSATSYTWSNSANTVSTTVTPTITSNYTVTVSNGTCTANATVSVTVNPCIGIEELSSNGISIYPNPTIDKLNIAINADLVSITSVSIYDALGKLVITEKLNTELTTIRTSNLDAGVYFVKITTNNREIKIGKLVKQ